MFRLSRSTVRLVSVIFLSAAILIVIAAGLPNRAAYTGVITPGQPPTAPEVGALAPRFTGITPSGDTLELVALRGVPVVVNFWATWCAPCILEMPELQTFHEAHPNIHMIGVNLGESAEHVARWMQNGGFTYPTVLDLSGAVARLYALRGQPTTVILSPNGIVLNIVYGATTRAALESVLAPYLD